MSTNKYKRRSRGGRFDQQGQNRITEVDQIKRQRQIEIDALKQQALQHKESSKLQISGKTDVAKSESWNRNLLQELEVQQYNNKRRAISLRGQREVENLEGQAKELGLQSEFWEKFATKYSKNLGDAAKGITNYAQYRAAVNAYSTLNVEDKKKLEETYKGLYDTVEKEGKDGALQVVHSHGLPTQEDLKTAKLGLERVVGSWANNRHFWKLVVSDFKANIDYHMSFVRENSLDKDGNNMYNSRQAPELLMNHITLFAHQNGIPLGSKEFADLVSTIKQKIPGQVRNLKLQEDFKADDIKRSSYIESTNAHLESWRKGDVTDQEMIDWIEAMHWFNNGSTHKFTNNGKTTYEDLSTRTDLTKKDRIALTYNWLVDNAKFSDYAEARKILNIPVRDPNGKVTLNKENKPSEFMLDKLTDVDDILKETFMKDVKKKKDNNILELTNERMNFVNDIEAQIKEDGKDNNYDDTLWNEDWLTKNFSKVDTHDFKTTGEQSRFYDLVGFPTNKQVTVNEFINIRSEFRSGDINGALFQIYKLKTIPSNMRGIHEAINAIGELDFDDFNGTLKKAIKEEFTANIKARPAKLAKFTNSNDLNEMTNIAAARFMDLFLDNKSITDPSTRYRTTLDQLAKEIELGMTLQGNTPGSGLFALTKEKGSAYGFSFVALGGGDSSVTLTKKDQVKQMFTTPSDEVEEGVQEGGVEQPLKPYEEGLLENVVTENFGTIFPESNDVRKTMTNFLKGNSNYGNLPRNLQRFISETKKLYPNLSDKNIMDSILGVVTSGKAQIGDETIIGYEKYNNTAWPPSTQDLTKMLIGNSTGDDTKDRNKIIFKLLKDNGIDLNEMVGGIWKKQTI